VTRFLNQKNETVSYKNPNHRLWTLSHSDTITRECIDLGENDRRSDLKVLDILRNLTFQSIKKKITAPHFLSQNMDCNFWTSLRIVRESAVDSASTKSNESCSNMVINRFPFRFVSTWLWSLTDVLSSACSLWGLNWWRTHWLYQSLPNFLLSAAP
jgi:hypothetical protein